MASLPETDPLDATRSTYDAVAADYARPLPGTAAEAPGDLDMIRRLAGTVPVGGRFLDAGCGAGRMAGQLASLGHTAVEGVDLSPGMIAQARVGHPTAGFTVADLAALHDVDDIAGLLVRHGFAVEEAVEHPACGHEREPQGFVLAHRG